LMIAGVAIATLLWLLVSQFWTSITIGARRLVGPVHDAQSAMAIVPITNSEPSNDRR